MATTDSRRRHPMILGVLIAGWTTIVTTQPAVSRQTPSPSDDVAEALAVVRARAEAGDVVAQYSLGIYLSYQRRDISGAQEWLERAANQEYAPAEFEMGLAADRGVGQTPDADEALRWYERAARHGSAPAARTMGDAYHFGWVGIRDPDQALRWYTRAAEAGDLLAQYRLGRLYFDGEGFPRDYVRAYVWFDRAAAQTPLEDNRKAIEELRNLAYVRMSADERVEVELLGR